MELTLTIKTINDRNYEISINDDLKVKDLKSKICEMASIPVNHQRLIYRGKYLKNEDFLHVYHVENHHTIHLVVKNHNLIQSQQERNSRMQQFNEYKTWFTSDARHQTPLQSHELLGQYIAYDQFVTASGSSLPPVSVHLFSYWRRLGTQVLTYRDTYPDRIPTVTSVYSNRQGTRPEFIAGNFTPRSNFGPMLQNARLSEYMPNVMEIDGIPTLNNTESRDLNASRLVDRVSTASGDDVPIRSNSAESSANESSADSDAGTRSDTTASTLNAGSAIGGLNNTAGGENTVAGLNLDWENVNREAHALLDSVIRGGSERMQTALWVPERQDDGRGASVRRSSGLLNRGRRNAIQMSPEPYVGRPNCLDVVWQSLYTLRSMLQANHEPFNRSIEERWHANQWVDVALVHESSQWMQGYIMDIRNSLVHVRYNGLPDAMEWIEGNSSRLAPFGTYTNCVNYPNSSPTPRHETPHLNIWAASQSPTIEALHEGLQNVASVLEPYAIETSEGIETQQEMENVAALCDRLGRALVDYGARLHDQALPPDSSNIQSAGNNFSRMVTRSLPTTAQRESRRLVGPAVVVQVARNRRDRVRGRRNRNEESDESRNAQSGSISSHNRENHHDSSRIPNDLLNRLERLENSRINRNRLSVSLSDYTRHYRSRTAANNSVTAVESEEPPPQNNSHFSRFIDIMNRLFSPRRNTLHNSQSTVTSSNESSSQSNEHDTASGNLEEYTDLD